MIGKWVLEWPCDRPLLLDVGELTSNPNIPRGADVVVFGTWETTAPSEGEYMMVIKRGRNNGRATCHFEDVPTTCRSELESRLLGSANISIRGRFDGIKAGDAVLRDCRFQD